MKAEVYNNGNRMTISLIPETIEEASLVAYMSTNKTKETSTIYTTIGGKDFKTWIQIPMKKNPETWIENK